MVNIMTIHQNSGRSFQFAMAQEKGQIYWLYVVERADSNDYNIIRIQDPTHLVTQFMFDDGWRAYDATAVNEP